MSNVLGAILMFGLFVMTMVTVQVQYVPIWTEDREARQMERVQDQFALLKANVDRQSDEAFDLPLSAPVTLRRDPGFKLFGSSTQSGDGDLVLRSVGSGTFTLTSPELTLTQLPGTDFAGLGENWTAFGAGEVTSATEIASLRMRIAGAEHIADGHDDFAYLQVTDATGSPAGRVEVFLDKMETKDDHTRVRKATLVLQTFTADDVLVYSGTIVVNNAEFDDANAALPLYLWIDLLDPAFRFDRVLAAARAPFGISLTTTGGLPAEYAATYFQETTAGGQILVGAGDQLVPNFSQALASASLRYTGQPSRYVAQNVVLEHGAVVVAQNDGAVIAVPPAFSVSSAGDLLTLDWTIPRLQPDLAGVPRGDTATVVTRGLGQSLLLSTAPSFTATLATDYGSAWATFWRSTFTGAGMVEGTSFTIAQTGTSASFTMLGNGAAGAHDVALTLRLADILVSL